MNLMFRVALFLRDEFSLTYDLIPSDIAILTMLASHLGEREYWYISQHDIAKACRLKPRQFYARSKNLEKQRLITIKRTGKANAYALTLPNIPGKQWSADQHSTADHQKPDQHSTADQISTRVPIRSALECRHKETIKKQKETERGALSDFIPNEENQSILIELNLNMTEELLSFKNRHKGAKTQYEFERWIKQSAKYQQRNQQQTDNNVVIPSAREWGRGHPDYDRKHGYDRQGVPNDTESSKAGGDHRR